MTEARPRTRAAAAMLSVTHIAAFGLWFAGLVPVAPLVGLALLAPAVIAVALRLPRALALLLAGATLTLGPLAGPILWIMQMPRRDPIRQAVPGHVSHAPSPADRVMAQIEAGRRYHARTTTPVPFIEIFDSGNLADQQAALSALARNYGPELRPALDRALASDIPAVRVQAAAAFAVLRDQYAARARALATADLSPAAQQQEIEDLRASGFVDPAALPPPAPIQTISARQIRRRPRARKAA